MRQNRSAIMTLAPRERHVNYLNHFVRDPQICNGQPVIRGTRVILRTILASLAEGCEQEDILRNTEDHTQMNADRRARIHLHKSVREAFHHPDAKPTPSDKRRADKPDKDKPDKDKPGKGKPDNHR
jgi:uncharacterized protein (DUF433 family)